MHRTLCRPRTLLLGGLLLALFLCGRPEALKAQVQGTAGNALIVPLGGPPVPLQMNTKKAISLIKNTNGKVLRINTIEDDPTRVFLVGQQAGTSHIDLTDVDGKVESHDVIVQLDIEYLRTQLKRVLPTANIEPVPVGGNSVILRGVVNHAEDADTAMRAAQAIGGQGGLQFTNAMRVAGVQQVQLCVTVAQVDRSEFRRMAFDFLTDGKNFFFGSTGSGAVAQPGTVGVGSSILNATLGGQVLSGIPGTPNGAPTNLLFGVIHNRWGFLGFLQALRDDAVVKSMSEPTLTTESGRPASFLIGGEQAVPVPAGLGQVGVQFEEFGTRLNFVPIVLGNGKIHLEVEPEVSSLNAANGTSISGTVVPGRNTARVNTTIELEDGQTFVIGGLVQRDVVGTTTKTPILGDLPFLGAAFSSKAYQEREQEVVILVTPHLVDPQDCAQTPKILPGEETRRPDDFELFLEGILEPPHGQRQVFQDHRYVAPYKNGPTAEMFPCAGRDGCRSGCNTGCTSCGADQAGTVLPPARLDATTPIPAHMDVAKPLPVDVKAAAAPIAPPAPPEVVKPAPESELPPIPAAPVEVVKPAAPPGLPATLPPAVAAPGDDGK